MRLSNQGFHVFLGSYKFHHIVLNDHITSKIVLQAERCFTHPYYFQQQYAIPARVLHLLSEKDAAMLLLHGGDLAAYLNNLENNK